MSLRQSRDSTLDRALEVGICLVLNGRLPVLSVTDSIGVLLGFTADDYLSARASLKQQIHPHDSDIADLLFSTGDPGTSGTFNIRLRHANGRIRCIRGQYSKEFGPEGLVLNLLLQDAKALQRTTTDASATVNFAAMMENTDDYISFKDRNHVIAGASQTLLSLCDPAESEHWTDLIGQTDYDIFPEEYADFFYRLEKQIFSGIPVANEIQKTVAKDGRNGWIDSRKYPIQDEHGEIIGVFGIARDVTERKQTETALQEKKHLLLESQRIAHIGGWSWSFTGQIQWTDETYRIYDVSPETFSPTLEALVNLLHPEDRPLMQEWVRACSAGEKPAEFEFRCVWSDGTVRFLSGRGELVNDAENRPSHIFGTVQDITELRLAEAAKHESQRTLAAVLEHMSEGVMVADAERNVIYRNPACFRIFGCDPNDINENLLDNWQGWDEQGRPLNAEEWPLSRVVRGERVQNQVVKLRPVKAGHEVLASYNGSPIYDADGRLVVSFITIHDITERKRAEVALHESHALLKVAGRIAHFGGWSVNLADGEQTWSDEVARIHEESPGFVPSVSEGINYYAPEWREKIAAVFDDCVRHGTPYDEEMQIVTAGGRRVWVRAVGEAVRDAAGVTVRVQGAFQNIDERKHAEEQILRLNSELEQRVIERTAQLEAANRELEAFSYSVSHDLRAPLRAVDGFSQAVLEDFGPQLPSEGQRQLQTIRSSAQKMGALIDDLLRFSRLSRAPLQKQEFDTGMLVRSVIDELQRHGDGPNVELRIGDLPLCTGDPALLRQVWLNLLSNAFKYTRRHEAAVVEVGCEAKPGGTIYFVRDNGAGFDMRYVDKLFGVFQRLHRAEDYEGTGVGLAIAQRVIHRHGGRIWAEAVVDRGATFYFTVPEGSNP